MIHTTDNTCSFIQYTSTQILYQLKNERKFIEQTEIFETLSLIHGQNIESKTYMYKYTVHVLFGTHIKNVTILSSELSIIIISQCV